MAFIHRAVTVLLSACSLAGCSGGTMTGVTAGIGLADSNDAKSKSSSSADGDSEHAKANAPQQVTGSFLTCAYMSSEKELLAAAKAGQPTEFGCGLYHQVGTALVATDISGLNFGAGIRCPSARVQKAPAAALPRTSNLQFKIDVQPDQLACTIAMALSGTDHTVVAFGRSIPTINQLDANNGFTVINDVEASGLTFASDGTPRFAQVPSLALFDKLLKEMDASSQANILKLLKMAPLVPGGKVPPPDSPDDTTPVVSYPDSSTASSAPRRKAASPSSSNNNSNGGNSNSNGGNSNNVGSTPAAASGKPSSDNGTPDVSKAPADPVAAKPATPTPEAPPAATGAVGAAAASSAS